MKLRLQTHVALLGVLAAGVPLTAAAVVAWRAQRRVEDSVANELANLSRQNARQVVLDAYNQCRTMHELVQHQVELSLAAAREAVAQRGGLKVSPDKVRWDVEDPPPGVASRWELPRLLVGSQWLGQVRATGDQVPVVDDARKRTGASVSVLQRASERGDLLRVATTLRGAGGTRALATLLPATLPDGSPDPIVEALLRGESYRGLSHVLGSSYLTAYEPFRDDRGRVAGALAVGQDVAGIAILREALTSVRLGRDGYLFVLTGTGPGRGSYVISKDGARDGESLWGQQDASGNKPVQEMVTRALAAAPGEVAFHRYPWQNPGESAARMKLSAFTYFAPWDWVVGAGVYEDDYYAVVRDARAQFDDLQRGNLAIMVAALFLAGLASVRYGRRLAAPLRRLTEVAKTVARGDLHAAARLASEGGGHGLGARETQELARAQQEMAQRLITLLGQVKETSAQVLSSASQISATAKQERTTFQALGTSTTDVATTVQEISSTSQELVRTMSQVSEVSRDTARLADDGRTKLQGMEQHMCELAGATHAISARLEAINAKAADINSIITTINRVADQTNLLSLNAAIQAEKAGEHGLGFGVVAREIRRLADQTGSATLDIEQMVKQMQDAVSDGVGEMETFTEAVKRGTQEVGLASTQLGRVIERVQDLTPRFQQAQEGMQAQAQGASQIHESIQRLNGGLQEALSSLDEFNRATDHMHGAVRNLNQEVDSFKVRA
jgi:methyl-accepting chemotaxis protein